MMSEESRKQPNEHEATGVLNPWSTGSFQSSELTVSRRRSERVRRLYVYASTVSFRWKYISVSLRSTFQVSIFVIFSLLGNGTRYFIRLNFDVRYRDYCEWRKYRKDRRKSVESRDLWPLTIIHAIHISRIYDWLKLLMIVQMLKKLALPLLA